MGVASAFEPRFRSALPDTPPEVLTPDSASFPSRQSEERPWNPRAPPSPPMSNYDPTVKTSDMLSSSRKGSEETSGSSQESAVANQRATRQQLPPLSSILGPASQLPPLHSVYPDRPGTYTTTSPLDHPLRPTMGSSSYFPSPISASSQPRTLPGSRAPDRPQIPPLSQVFPGPLSPLPRQEQRQDVRSEYGSGTQWSVQHESNREYSLGSRDHQFYQPAPDQYPVPLAGPGRDEGRKSEYREQLTLQTPMHSSAGSPTGIVGTETLPAKDGLGPRIWTGTHFLPRFVRAAEVPGEGMCYFYDDGSHCKTVIDGEAVNAHWGVTKAGKPRKRLAIACVTCREKKIKCDPDYPRCVQCEKFGRVCKFKNAPRGGHNTSPSTPPAEPEGVRRLGGVPRPPTADHARPGSHSSESVSPRTTLRPLSPDPSLSGPRKQARVSYEHYSPTAGRRSPMASIYDPARPAYSWRPPPPPLPQQQHQSESLPRIHEGVLSRPWQSEPRPDARV